MAVFLYTALDGAGRTVEGTVDAGTKHDAYRQLEERDLTPVEVRAEGRGAAWDPGSGEGEATGPPRLKKPVLILFTEELADLLEAGVQLQQALSILQERQGDRVIKRVAGLLGDELREGATFSAALRKTSPSFDELYCNLVAAGEVSGSLGQILRRLAANLTIMHELQSRMIQALIYPAFMILACILLMVVFMTVLVPQLTSLMSSAKQKLPLPTRMLVSLSDFFVHTWWMWALGLAVAVLLFRAVLARPEGRLWWDEWKLRIPLLGPVLATRFYAGFCQSLGNLLLNGVPLLSGLRLMSRATANAFFRARLEEVQEQVGGGDSLSGALRRSGKFAPLMVDMIAIGEQTGTLSRSLEKAGGRFDKELSTRIRRLTALISPVIIIFLAVVVTAVAYSVVAAIFQSVSGIRSRG